MVWPTGPIAERTRQDGAIAIEAQMEEEPPRASTERGAVGTRVALQGLARRPDLNGRTGTIVQGLNGRGRLGVQLDTDSEAAPIACKPENICSPRNGGEVAVKVLFDADVFCHLAELLRGWSSDAFADVARMRRVCSSWNRALQKVSRRVDLGKGMPFPLDAKRLLLIEDRIATVVRQAPPAPPRVPSCPNQAPALFHRSTWSPQRRVRSSRTTAFCAGAGWRWRRSARRALSKRSSSLRMAGRTRAQTGIMTSMEISSCSSTA